MKSPEAILQSQCVIQFSQRFPEKRGQLIGYFATTASPIQGAMMNSLGLIKNVSDLLYVEEGRLIGIEMKAPESSHNRLHLIGQAEWLIKIPHRGYFCDSLEMFFSIISGENGIDPAMIREKCLSLTTKNVEWNKLTSFN